MQECVGNNLYRRWGDPIGVYTYFVIYPFELNWMMHAREDLTLYILMYRCEYLLCKNTVLAAVIYRRASLLYEQAMRTYLLI